MPFANGSQAETVSTNPVDRFQAVRPIVGTPIAVVLLVPGLPKSTQRNGITALQNGHGFLFSLETLCCKTRPWDCCDFFRKHTPCVSVMMPRCQTI